VHYHTIQINQPTRSNSFISLLHDVYVWLNMFRAPLRPSSGAYNCTRNLWFYRWSVAVGALLVVVWQVMPGINCNSFTSLLLDVYVWLNMFWAPLLPSSGTYNCTRSLWFYRWSVAVGALLVVVCQAMPGITTTNNAPKATFQR
jgi:hypothetical protein